MLHPSNIELRNEEVQDILTKIPHWMIRWGNFVILIIIFLILLFSYLIKYPEVVSSKIIITTKNPPEKLFAKTSGRIKTLFVQNKDTVSPDTPLAIIKNTVNYEKRVYVMRSSIRGQIFFRKTWSENQAIKPEELMFIIIPVRTGGYTGKASVKVENSEKIKVGQQVRVHLNRYPENKFGILTGIVKFISPIPDAEGNLLIDIELSDDLVASNGKKISFHSDITGTANIVTDDLRLIERFVYWLN